MDSEDKKPKEKDDTLRNLDMEQLLEQRARLDSLLQQKFTRRVTVMFTDLKGSTQLTEDEGDIAIRILIKQHNDILFSVIEKNKGVLVKTMGDGTLSYYESAQDAVRAAVQIQAKIGEYNRIKKPKIPILMRVGLHTGIAIIEKNDIFGDAVNVASRFETLARPGEIYLSEDTYNSLADKEEICCRFIKTSTLKGKKDAFKVFRVFWNKEEIEAYESGISKSEPSLVLERENQPKQIIPLTQKDIFIGRSSECDVVIEGRYISRRHARIFIENGSYVIEDLKSTLGMTINGEKTSRHLLKDKDEITLGTICLTFVEPSREESTDSGAETVLFTPDEEAIVEKIPSPRYKLVVLSAEEEISEYPVTEEGLLIGRLPTTDTSSVQLHDRTVSRSHAKIWCDGDNIYIKDLDSHNGTYVGEKRITKSKAVEIKEKQEIRICSYRLLLLDLTEKADISLFTTKGPSFGTKLKGLWGKRTK